ncbi:hypothetical protein V8C86DRAFT_2612655 [Haematococcus lacustris]
MLQDNNLVRHLDACETMACATTVCSDKTGTLTANCQTVTQLWAGGKRYRAQLSSGRRSVSLNPAIQSVTEAGEGGVWEASNGKQATGARQMSANGGEAVTGGIKGGAGQPPSGHSAVLTRSAPTPATAKDPSLGPGSWGLQPAGSHGLISSGGEGSRHGSPAQPVVPQLAERSHGSQVGLLLQQLPEAEQREGAHERLRRARGAGHPAVDAHGDPGVGGEGARDGGVNQGHGLDLAAVSLLSWEEVEGQGGRQGGMDAWNHAGHENGANADGDHGFREGEGGRQQQAGWESDVVSSGGSVATASLPTSQARLSSPVPRAIGSQGLPPLLKDLMLQAACLCSTASLGPALQQRAGVTAAGAVETVEAVGAVAANGAGISMAGNGKVSRADAGASVAAAGDRPWVEMGSRSGALLTGEAGLQRLGNRTECALLEFCLRLGDGATSIPGVEMARAGWQVLQLLPFTSERKRMSVLATQAMPGSSGVLTNLPINSTTVTARVPARLFIKGAAELVLKRCTAQLGPDGKPSPLDPVGRQAILNSFGSDGLRLLALAYRDLSLAPSSWPLPAEELETELVLLGVLGLQDPLRPDVQAAIQQCRRAGIAVRMLTGDNARTAAAIARQCGILPPDTDLDTVLAEGAALAPPPTSRFPMTKSVEQDAGETAAAGAGAGAGGQVSLGCLSGTGPLVLEGPSLRRMLQRPDGSYDTQAFRAVWPRLRVLARCSPTDKFLLVSALKKERLAAMAQDEEIQRNSGLTGQWLLNVYSQAMRGAHSSSTDKSRETVRARNVDGAQSRPPVVEVVAMTGDGTNDAPALTAADVGFAMNSGTSIAKDAADILLMDDSFSSIVAAVKWGRNVYASVSKFLQFQLTANVVAVSTACGAALTLQSTPLSAVQMLWVNLIMDSLASLALATEAPTDELLDLPPCSPSQPLIGPELTKHIVGQAAYQLTVMWLLVAHGKDIPGIAVPSQACLDTLTFNTFVCLQLFNQINCRKVRDEPHVLEGLGSAPWFCAILAAEATLQVGIVQAGGLAFQTVPLSAQQWGLSLGLGALTLVVREGLRRLPTAQDRGVGQAEVRAESKSM